MIASSSAVGVAVFVLFIALFLTLTVFVIRFARQLGRRTDVQGRDRPPGTGPGGDSEEG
jgi:hypothetical protein